jgi:hypothetical protein
MKKYIIGASVIAVVAFITLGVSASINRQQTVKVGSVSFGGEYHSTSTSAGIMNRYLIQSGQGTLGSVIVTKVGSVGTLTIYDATSSSSGNIATTTIASIPTNIAVGTYTFDVSFQNGLLIEGLATMGSSTITFR